MNEYPYNLRHGGNAADTKRTRTMSKERNLEVATTILNQLGAGKFKAMTGAKEFSLLDNGLRFKIGRNSTQTNTVSIQLNGLDLYDLTFEKVSISRKTWEVNRKVINKTDSVFFEDMKHVFTEVTGMYTSL